MILRTVIPASKFWKFPPTSPSSSQFESLSCQESHHRTAAATAILFLLPRCLLLHRLTYDSFLLPCSNCLSPLDPFESALIALRGVQAFNSVSASVWTGGHTTGFWTTCFTCFLRNVLSASLAVEVEDAAHCGYVLELAGWWEGCSIVETLGRRFGICA